jgi:hypothetical protein
MPSKFALALAAWIVALMALDRAALAVSPRPPTDYGYELIQRLKRLGTQGSLSNVEWTEAVFGAQFKRWSIQESGPISSYLPLPTEWESGREIGHFQSMLPGHPGPFQRLYIAYQVLNRSYTGNLPRWDKSVLAALKFYEIEEYACIASFHVTQAFDKFTRIENDLGHLFKDIGHYTYGYVLRRNDGSETDLLIRGPDRGQDGCVQDITVVERRTA